MKGVRFFGIVGAVCAVAAVVLSTQPAAAIGPDVDKVTFSGATGSLSPAIGLTSSTGSYTFSSSQCAFVSNDSKDFTPESGTCAIGASGSYSSIVCGTGTTGGGPLAHQDSATVSGTDLVTNGGETISVSYDTVFVGGIAVLEGVESDDSDVATGVFDIVSTGGDCVNGVTQFTATGSALIA